MSLHLIGIAKSTIMVMWLIGFGIIAVLSETIVAVAAQPETAYERMFNSFMGSSPILVTTLMAAYLAWKASKKADIAAVKADKAAVQAVEVKETVGVIATKTEEIGKQTDGHMTVLLQELSKLREKDDARAVEQSKELKTLHDFMMAELAKQIPKAPEAQP